MNYKLKKILISYFSSGWLFFLPYLILYLTFWITSTSFSILLNVFFIFHVINIVGLGYFIWLKYSLIRFWDLFFWAALFSLFINTGAYLEFPSDPWTHLFRIFQWEHVDKIHHADSNFKFAYFFGFSLLGHLDPLEQRIPLNIYHTFWGLITVVQFYKLANFTLQSKTWAKLGVACIIIMFGNSSFNFFSYYGISSTMLSMVGFLAAINSLLMWKNSKPSYNIFLISSALVLGFFNHPQSFLLFSVCVTGILFHFIITKHGWLGFFKIIGAGSIIIYILFYLIIKLPICDGFRDLLHPYNLSGEWFYFWGGFKLFSFNPEINNASGRFMQILGWYGVLNCFASLYLIKKNHVIGWISISPILVLLFPPFSQILAFILVKYDFLIVFQRVLLSIPISFSIILVLKSVTELKFPKVNRTFVVPLIFIFHLLISINPNSQYFGRFLNIFERPNRNSGFEKVFETSSLIKQSLTHSHKTEILADTATQTLINAQLGLTETNRLKAESLSSKISDLGGVLKIHSDSSVTHILTLSEEPYLNPISSVLGKSSGHWGGQHLAKCLQFDSTLQSKLDKLTNLGWIKKSLKPWYYLYERQPL